MNLFKFLSAPEITPVELNERLAAENPPLIVDVREPDELRVSKLAGARNIPMGDLARRLSELDKEKEYVVVCRSGSRSGQVVRFLRAQGYERVLNLAGGMNRWARDVDPSVTVY